MAMSLFAQNDRGTITGTITDPAQAVVPDAAVSARNTETGSLYKTQSTPTGNYTVPSLPAGVYELSVEAPGFKKSSATAIQVRVAEVARIDVQLQLGSASESITVQADAAQLKTESAEQSTNVTGDRINALPINFGGGGGSTGAIRDPLAFIVLSPGVSGTGGGGSVNGFGGSSYRVLFEGQDATSGNANARANETQGSVEAIEEYTLETNNFAAEYGQVTGGLVNFTARSGTNHFHGSGYDYFTNEALNATRPFSNVNPFSRKNDWGFTVGGPVRIPRLYNGHDKTFFFFNFERYDNTGSSNGTFQTLPTDAMRNGDFSQSLTGNFLLDSSGRQVLDPLGRPIAENAIYDPASRRTVNGQSVADPFPGNIIPVSRFDPVASKIQGLIPHATFPGQLVNNWNQNALSSKHQFIPAVKIDHAVTANDKLSFYWSEENTHQYSSADGLPAPITAVRDQAIYSHTTRLNYDKVIKPTLLAHLGVGYIRYLNPDSSPQSVLGYDAPGLLGLTGAPVPGFPRINGLGNSTAGGSSIGFGPTNANHYYNDKFTSLASVTWVHQSHTFKFGANYNIDIWTDRNTRGATGILNFSNGPTAQPSLNSTSSGGRSDGLGYASFLLGAVDSESVNPQQDPQWRKPTFGAYAQDTWKVTRKLTLDLGIRYDYQSEGHEIWYRNSEFGPNVVNPSAGGLKGGLIYEGYGDKRCNCTFSHAYPWAFAPRLGAAYQIDSKTVFRAGWGLVYGQLQGYNYLTNSAILGVGFNQLQFSNPGFGNFLQLKNGFQYNPADLYTANLDPGLVPSPGQINSPNYFIDPNGGRPPRVNEWSIGLQRQVTHTVVVEANYVGNRGVWESASSLVALNVPTPQSLTAAGLDLNSPNDLKLLQGPLSAAIATGRGFKIPYAGFSVSNSLLQSLRPYPQFSSSINPMWAPLGKSWYDSLQSKVTKRFSRGLDGTAAFTWAKTEGNPAGGVNNLFDRALQKGITSNDIPLIFVVGFTYEVPKFGHNRFMTLVARGWSLGGLLQYQSGSLIGSPGSNNNLGSQIGQGTRFNRVPGVPLFLKDPNCHCVNPSQDLVLNPAAWSDAPAGQFGTSSAFYDDYRQQRRPNEQLSLGRTFHFGREGMSFSVRAEFFNVFNRTELGNPSSGNPAATVTHDKAGNLTGGFGYINATAISNQPRNGQLVGRFTW